MNNSAGPLLLEQMRWEMFPFGPRPDVGNLPETLAPKRMGGSPGEDQKLRSSMRAIASRQASGIRVLA